MVHIFIINPFAGDKSFASNLRDKLATLEDINYFVFNTRYPGYEAELVRKSFHIFEGEKLRFYCCGGSGTMRNMLNGFENFSDVEIAFYPNGLTNDFLKMFGKHEPRFHDIDELIHGDVVDVDYIKSNHGICLNSLSTGMDSNSVKKMNEMRILRIIDDAMPYLVSVLYSIFVSRPLEYDLKVDGKTYREKYTEIFCGNGSIFGGRLYFAKHTAVDDGKAILRLIGNKHGFPLIPILTALTGKQYDVHEKYMTCGHCKKITFKRVDGKPFTINQDGDLIENVEFCEAEIVQKGLHFVVPKGVRL